MNQQDKRDKIVSRLAKLERQENATILYACESGSRAWGFASKDSDWDVRFIYFRPLEWYLSIDLERQRDVIEVQEEDKALDISGWDIKKALNLFMKTNPPLIEWLHSPIVYMDRLNFREKLQALLPQYYSPKSCFHHYLHMARGNYRQYLRGKAVRLKKYLYVIRPLLALRWIAEKNDVVPVPFMTLLEEISLTEKAVYKEVCLLLEKKQRGGELDTGPRVSILNDFIEEELQRFTELDYRMKRSKAAVEPLNELFREIVGG